MIAPHPGRLPEQVEQGVAGLLGAGVWAGLVAAAGSIHFTRGDSSDAQARALSAPDGTVAIVDHDRRAGELLARGDDDRGGEGEEDHPNKFPFFS
jgi:hypothetical protein